MSRRISRKRTLIFCVIFLVSIAGLIVVSRIYSDKHITKYDAFYTLFEQYESDFEKRFVDFAQREEDKIYKEIIYKYACEINGHPVTKELSFFEEVENMFVKYSYWFDDLETAFDYAQKLCEEMNEYYGEDNDVTNSELYVCNSLKKLETVSQINFGESYRVFWDAGIDCEKFTEMTGMEYYRCDISFEFIAMDENLIRLTVRYQFIPKF